MKGGSASKSIRGIHKFIYFRGNTGELAYDRLNGTMKISSVICKVRHILDMHGTGTKHIVCHSQKSGVHWSVITSYASSPAYPKS